MQRIRFFDIAKGIAILAVILGHSAIEANVFIPHHTAQLVVAVCADGYSHLCNISFRLDKAINI